MSETDKVPMFFEEQPDLVELLTRLLVEEDEEAFRQFARIVHGRIYHHFFSRCRLPQFEAEDLTVSTITKIVIEFSKYKPKADAKFEAWMMTLVRNEGTGWIRTHRTRLESLDGSLEGIEDVRTPVEAPADPIKIAVVQEALGRLSEEDRVILQMRISSGDQLYTDIAGRLGITNGAARVRFFRAKARLQKLLEQDARLRTRRSA